MYLLIFIGLDIIRYIPINVIIITYLVSKINESTLLEFNTKQCLHKEFFKQGLWITSSIIAFDLFDIYKIIVDAVGMLRNFTFSSIKDYLLFTFLWFNKQYSSSYSRQRVKLNINFPIILIIYKCLLYLMYLNNNYSIYCVSFTCTVKMMYELVGKSSILVTHK